MNQKVAIQPKTEVVPADDVPPFVPAVQIDPLQMVQAALEKGAEIETLKLMMDLRDREEARNAKQAYLHAVSEFKKNPPEVINDMVNDQYGSGYSSLANLVNTGNSAMAPFGLNTDWEFDQSNPELITVTCVLSHEMGHSKSVTLSGPPDDSGKKNLLQRIKSTLTYLKIATYEGVTGIASRGGNTDDDGAGAANNGNAPTWECVSPEQLKALNDLIAESGTDQARFLDWCDVDKLEHLPAANFQASMDALNHKKNSTQEAK